ncbi:antitoxin Xre/MbcA/ParS toxin-binding domain-containing protein [Calderihabitans maritimus]|uniref:SEC-C motif domain-containing protein n=1 Tax=Calderihabitans maritimus TaxID=1246530 RepID=A0A1Z5HRA2_9FIRM|nr:antitoxin Xre/MbcA/ParS toxin-binding domain-containing protein [Calderihabitans maritimus]GAW92059.1 SEC-C motif domain-containing protein [Calderihabitans maritimus]
MKKKQKNNPSSYGNGEEYAGGCDARDQKVIDFDRWRFEHAVKSLKAKLGYYSDNPAFDEAKASAFVYYFGDLEDSELEELGEEQWLEFLEWFIFDYPVKEDKTVVALFKDAFYSRLNGAEQQLLEKWISARISLYKVKEVVSPTRVILEDLLRGGTYCLKHDKAGDEFAPNSLVVTRLLAAGDYYEVSLRADIIPGFCFDALIKMILEDYNFYRKEFASKGVFDWDQYLQLGGLDLRTMVEELAETLEGPERQPNLKNLAGGDVLLEEYSRLRDLTADLLPELGQLLQNLHWEEYFTRWIDEPNPELEGETPRTKCKTSEGRRQVEELLRKMEKQGDFSYDLNRVRKKLGILNGSKSPAVSDYRWEKPAYRRVALLIQDKMEEDGYTPEQIGNALKLWYDFTKQKEPRFRKPAVWAATVEYSIARLEYMKEVTQQYLAGKYAISPNTISANYRQIYEALSISGFDARYSTQEAPNIGWERLALWLKDIL